MECPERVCMLVSCRCGRKVCGGELCWVGVTSGCVRELRACGWSQEWNEVQFNGVYYEPPGVSEPGVLEPDKNYTFKYPRPPR